MLNPVQRDEERDADVGIGKVAYHNSGEKIHLVLGPVRRLRYLGSMITNSHLTNLFTLCSLSQ